MAFWGSEVTAAKSKVVDTPEAEPLHLSHACLGPDTTSGTDGWLLIHHGGKNYAVAHLKEGTAESCSLDLFIPGGKTKLEVKGKATMHLTGYFENAAADEETKERPAEAGSASAAKAKVNKEEEDEDEGDEEEESEEEEEEEKKYSGGRESGQTTTERPEVKGGSCNGRD